MTRYPEIDARLAWAAHHVARLRQLVDVYSGLPPYEVSDGLDDDGRTRVVRATLQTQPSVEISLALGDVAHQLRAVLDNAVGALSDTGPTRTSEFVITRDPKTFEKACRDGRLTGLMLSPEAQVPLQVVVASAIR